jgi:hypothetical protein
VKTNPVLLTVILAVLTEAASAAVLIAQDHTTVGIVVAIAGAVTAVCGVVARNMVTPLADPKDAQGRPLIPDPPSEKTLSSPSGGPIVNP